jgi:hypothetical protein
MDIEPGIRLELRALASKQHRRRDGAVLARGNPLEGLSVLTNI